MKNIFISSLIVISLLLLGIILSNNVEAKQMQIATLTGYETTPPTDTEGIGIFIMGPASFYGIQYLIVLSDIDKVTEVNLQRGEKGQTGKIIVNLFNSSSSTDPVKGILKRDIILSDIDKAIDKVTEEVNLFREEKGQTGKIILDFHSSPNEPVKGVLISDSFNSTESYFDPASPDQNDVYVNVVTEDHPQGELRGQLHWVYPFFDLFEN